MYGTETIYSLKTHMSRFENDVKMYGTETKRTPDSNLLLFENDVKMYGTETYGSMEPWLD